VLTAASLLIRTASSGIANKPPEQHNSSRSPRKIFTRKRKFAKTFKSFFKKSKDRETLRRSAANRGHPAIAAELSRLQNPTKPTKTLAESTTMIAFCSVFMNFQFIKM